MKPDLLSVFRPLLEGLPPVYLPKNKTIYQPGDQITHIPITKNGYFRLSDQEYTYDLIHSTTPLLYFGHQLNIAINFSIQTFTPVEVWLIPIVNFSKFVNSHEDAKTKLTSEIYNYLQFNLQKTRVIATGTAYTKVCFILHSLASRFGITQNSDVRFDFDTTHYLLATLTGLTRETTTLQLLKLKRQGIIGNLERSRLVIKDLTKLEKFST